MPGAKLLASPWPPTIEIGWVEQIMRGPGTRPWSIAFASAMSEKPQAAMLRTVVKPASSVARAEATPRMASSAAVFITACVSQPLSTSSVRWAWQSMKPGVIV